jgi:molecular chaperone HscB
MDAFDTLGLSPALDLDVALLEQRYRDLQRALHPDKFAQASSSEKRESLSKAVSVNEAYRALKNPLKRAEILIVRLGGVLPKEQADPELLMEVMELRESLGEAKAARNLAQAHALAGDVRKLEDATMNALRSAVSDAEQNKPEAIARATRALGRLRYYVRFHDEVARIEEDLEA